MMNLRTKIAIVAAVAVLALAVGCQELPGYLAGEAPLARVDDAELLADDARVALPAGISGEDSVAFMKVYIDRWVRQQLKLQEAETLFSVAAGDDIERLVEEYRQTLLIRKLDQLYVDRSIDTTFTAEQIETYYNDHKSDFRLDRTLVKGRIVRFEGLRQAQKVHDLLGSRSASAQQDLRDICEKNNFEIADFGGQWVDFAEFLSHLPVVRSNNYDTVLASVAVQKMRDSRYHYYFRLDEVRREGEPIPLERLHQTIQRILFTQRQGEIVRAHEEELLLRGMQDGTVRVFE